MQSFCEVKELDQNQLFQLFLTHLPKQSNQKLPEFRLPSEEEKRDQLIQQQEEIEKQKQMAIQEKLESQQREQLEQQIEEQLFPKKNFTVQTSDSSGDSDFQSVEPTWGNLITNSVRTTGIKDGSKWRKYGQKVIKNNPFPKNYFKCTVPNCPAKKYVEKVVDSNGQHSIKTVYVDKHIHEGPDFLSLVISSQSDYDKALTTIFANVCHDQED